MRGLRKIRRQQDYTLKDVARGVNSTQNTIWRIEKGIANPSWDIANRIAEFLGCTLDDLKGDTEH